MKNCRNAVCLVLVLTNMWAGVTLSPSPSLPLSPLWCSNGIGRSGIFIALHIILERMVAEGLVDVFQTIKNLRIQRPAMVQTLVSGVG